MAYRTTLPTADAPHQAISKKVGLVVFASEALSSTAYATQEILIVLAFAGTAAFAYSLLISLAIVILLAVVRFSYELTIHAYPSGGGKINYTCRLQPGCAGRFSTGIVWL